MMSFAGAVWLCTALVQKQHPTFDAYVPLNEEEHVSMLTNEVMAFQFYKCMDAHGHPIEDAPKGNTP